jgi:hypothetical protein
MASLADPQPTASRDGVDPPAGAGYRLERPTLADAHTALERLYGPHTEDVWQTLLFRSGLSGHETDPVSFDRLVNCMMAAEPITRLCGRSLAVRAAAHARIPAARTGSSAG